MNGLAGELDHLPTEDLEVVPNAITTIVERAASRGQIGPRRVPAHILDAPAALLRHELVVQHRRPSDEQLAAIIVPAIQRAAMERR